MSSRVDPSRPSAARRASCRLQSVARYTCPALPTERSRPTVCCTAQPAPHPARWTYLGPADIACPTESGDARAQPRAREADEPTAWGPDSADLAAEQDRRC